VGIQRTGFEPPFTDAGMSSDDALVVALRGCLYSGDEVVAGDEAAVEIARAYRAGGIARAAKLPGAFAAVVADEGGIRAARSPLDGPALFWRRTPAGLAVASEAKQLCVGTLGTAAADPDALLAQVALDFSNRARTSYAGVWRLPAGAWIDLSETSPEPHVWWDADRLFAEEALPLAEAIATFRSLLRTAVARRMTAHTAVAMSGGLDSTPIAATAAGLHTARYGKPLQTVSAVFPAHPEADESARIAATAAALGLESHTLEPPVRPLEHHIADAELHDGPGLVVAPSLFRALLTAARDRGARTVLDGFDGDSLFGATLGVQRALVRRRRVPELRALARTRRRRDGTSSIAAARRELAAAFVPPALLDRYRRARGGLGGDDAPAWLLPPLSDGWRDARSGPRGWDWRRGQTWIYAEMLEIGLEHWDCIGLAAGTELLHPLLDRDLVEFCLRLPPEVKVAGGLNKALIRLGFPELPGIVTDELVKPSLDGPVAAATSKDAAARLVAAAPKVLPGVDWTALTRRLESGRPFHGPEVATLRLVLQADHVLGCTPTAFASAA
jgi:asparagine synthase (glutamine-hydrolysing)